MDEPESCAPEKCVACVDYEYRGMPFNWCRRLKCERAIDEWCKQFERKVK